MKKLISTLMSIELSTARSFEEVNSGLRHSRRVFGFAVAFIGLSLLSAGSVQAQEITGRACAMSGYLSFTGPLSKEEGAHEVYGEATISACVDENGPVEGATAEVAFSGEGTANCMLQDFALTQLVQWNSGRFDLVTLGPLGGDRAPLGSYKGTVDFGAFRGNKVIAVMINEEPRQTLNCLLGIDPIGTFTFRGVQIYTDMDSSL